MIPRADWCSPMGSRIRKGGYSPGSINDFYLPGYAKAGTDRIPSTTPGAEPPRDGKDSGSARSHSTHLETSSSNRHLPGASHGTKTKYPLRARDGRYACQVSRAHRTHSRL